MHFDKKFDEWKLSIWMKTVVFQVTFCVKDLKIIFSPLIGIESFVISAIEIRGCSK